MTDWIWSWLNTQHDKPKWKCTNTDRPSWLFCGAFHPSDRLERFCEFHPWALSYSRVIPGMQDRVIRAARMLLSCRPPDTIGRPVCGIEFQVTMDSRAQADLTVQHVSICLTSWVVSRILHFSGNRIPLYWLTVNMNINYNLGVNNSERDFCRWIGRRSGEGQEDARKQRQTSC